MLYPTFRGVKLAQKEINHFTLGDPEKQLVSRDYLPDPGQTPQPHNRIFLKCSVVWQ